MTKRKTDEKMDGLYIVALPRDLRGYPAFSEIPRYGTTQAVSEARAVSQYVMRHVPRETGQPILSALKQVYEDGLAHFAVVVPELDIDRQRVLPGGKRDGLSAGMVGKLKEYAVAMELASKVGSDEPGDFISEARHLLDVLT